MERAWAADSTIGIITPRAPRSSARASQVYSPLGTRTIGSIGRPRHDANSHFSVS
jgi:hypothetical protein